MDFNSIKVRLELIILHQTETVLAFQFHKGAIRTGEIRVVNDILVHFNSIKVRLEQRQNEQQNQNGQSISIP